MIIKINKDIALNDWIIINDKNYRLDARYSIENFHDLRIQDMPRIFIVKNINDYYQPVFCDSIRYLSDLFYKIYDTNQTAAKCGDMQKAKEFIDNFLIKISKLNSFI